MIQFLWNKDVAYLSQGYDLLMAKAAKVHDRAMHTAVSEMKRYLYAPKTVQTFCGIHITQLDTMTLNIVQATLLSMDLLMAEYQFTLLRSEIPIDMEENARQGIAALTDLLTRLEHALASSVPVPMNTPGSN